MQLFTSGCLLQSSPVLQSSPDQTRPVTNQTPVLPPLVPLGGVGNMKVTNPTITTLTVTWNPADGNVQGYKIIYVPADGGLEIVVRPSLYSHCHCQQPLV